MQPDLLLLVLMENLSRSSDESFDDPAQWNDWDADVEMEYGRGITPAQLNIIMFNGATKVYQAGETFLDHFNLDACAPQRGNNIYYPFTSRVEWDMAKYLLCSSLSMAKIDKFLKLDSIKSLHLSFRTVKDLRGRVELLPSGPQWQYHILMTTPWQTTQVVHLYFYDMLDCIEMLFNHPFFANKLDLIPQRIYETTEHLIHMYSEWMTGDAVTSTGWRNAPRGHSLLGENQYHEHDGLVNIKMEHHNKASNHEFVLAVLLPVVEFIHPTKRMQMILNDHLIHECLDIVREPLKQAVQLGHMMSDPVSNLHLCYMPITAHIVNTPEALMLACVQGLTSHLTLAILSDTLLVKVLPPLHN
ncbi:hypothetical protein PAXINDRAFT_15846 [Paxillus involutus ATCC 200175]|uniref:Unplaced genomic scaffold PAXINscaffold_62, whole genome shotgun sequence n=1 Tax=Paxillus involutus ATCC 200175 TaxID=664439 RepID=A0A0C9T690_PAXIN|nr:hypothetical protein PAXINDRAFT_15846 [Paxillus involutus ATCC 200175]